MPSIIITSIIYRSVLLWDNLENLIFQIKNECSKLQYLIEPIKVLEFFYPIRIE